jgi:transcription elongation factor GreA
MDKYYITKERLEELKKELDFLKTEKRLEIAENLKRAKEYGDLSENSEYAEAREEQSRVESRIFELDELFKKVVLIQPTEGSNTVEVGSTVIVAKNGESFTYGVVGSGETKPEEGKISNESPLGRAILGHKVGDSVSIKTPSGQIVYLITKIE